MLWGNIAECFPRGTGMYPSDRNWDQQAPKAHMEYQAPTNALPHKSPTHLNAYLFPQRRRLSKITRLRALQKIHPVWGHLLKEEEIAVAELSLAWYVSKKNP